MSNKINGREPIIHKVFKNPTTYTDEHISLLTIAYENIEREYKKISDIYDNYEFPRLETVNEMLNQIERFRLSICKVKTLLIIEDQELKSTK